MYIHPYITQVIYFVFFFSFLISVRKSRSSSADTYVVVVRLVTCVISGSSSDGITIIENEFKKKKKISAPRGSAESAIAHASVRAHDEASRRLWLGVVKGSTRERGGMRRDRGGERTNWKRKIGKTASVEIVHAVYRIYRQNRANAKSQRIRATDAAVRRQWCQRWSCQRCRQGRRCRWCCRWWWWGGCGTGLGLSPILLFAHTHTTYTHTCTHERAEVHKSTHALSLHRDLVDPYPAENTICKIYNLYVPAAY